MYFLKQCPRCNGDLAADSDQYGDFVSCLQCGLCKDVQVMASGSPIVHTDPARSSRTAAWGDARYRINPLQPQVDRSTESIPA